MKRFILVLCFFTFSVKAQFAPPAGSAGTTAIKKDSSIIVNWATHCKVTRGLQDISNAASPYADAGDSSKATGPADVAGIVSLGDGGSAILTFQSPIKNLSGPDFCVFENSFDSGFLELGFVEVSSDGINYTRFSATCNVQNTVQIGPFDTNSDASKINNLAGKYIGGYGVPFDLEELVTAPGLNTNAITHVKITDVVGCIQPAYARYDKNNNIINDIWSTPFGSCGFDLDAVGVIHQVPVSVTEKKLVDTLVEIFPTVTNEEVNILNTTNENIEVYVTDICGKEIMRIEIISGKGVLCFGNVKSGMYLIKVNSAVGSLTKKIFKTD